MSTTNLIPPVQDLVQQPAETLEEKLQQVETQMHDLEKKSEGTEGKDHAHYQERLIELCHTHETLAVDFAGLEAEESPRALMPLVPSL